MICWDIRKGQQPPIYSVMPSSSLIRRQLFFHPRNTKRAGGYSRTGFTEGVPYLAGILLASLVQVGAVMCCAVLDAKRSYYYPNRLRINILKKLLSKKDVTSVSGQSGSVFEVLDDDVSSSTFPAELLTKVSGYFIYTLIALSMLLIINWKLPMRSS